MITLVPHSTKHLGLISTRYLSVWSLYVPPPVLYGFCLGSRVLSIAKIKYTLLTGIGQNTPALNIYLKILHWDFTWQQPHPPTVITLQVPPEKVGALVRHSCVIKPDDNEY